LFQVHPAVEQGFKFHHAKPDYVLLTQWLPESPSSLPLYGFTQIGVGGVVVNAAGAVLMVVERVSPLPMFQGCWKLPGGLADPGEDFAETVLREVREETGVTGSLDGVVSLRHSHGFRFGQGDIYVVVKMKADNETITVDTKELQDARWMTYEEMESRVAESGQPLDEKISMNNWKVIKAALAGPLIQGSELPNSRGGRPTLVYTASTL
jgi:8-oxo-dGTP pyrophosphatase MutT (NUDIX family)